MKDQNGNGTTAVVAEYEEWEIQEFVDDAVAMDLIDAYVYSFKQGGREVTGLTARAIEHICLESRPRISISEFEIKDEGDNVLVIATAKAVYVTPTQTETQADGTVLTTEGYQEVVTAPGVHRAPKVAYGKPDPFAEQKALTKACRNARRQLISQAAQLKAKDDLLKLQGGKTVPVPQQALPTQSARQAPEVPRDYKAEQKERASRAAFATYREKREDLEGNYGITEAIFWGGVKAHYGVESRTEMSEQNFRELRSALLAQGYATWIQQLSPDYGSA